MSDKPLPPFLQRAIAIRSTDITPMQKFLLHTLNSRADRSGMCFPTYERLELDTGLSRSTVTRIIKQLRSLGMLIITRSGEHNHRNVYKINVIEGQSTVRPARPVSRGMNSQGEIFGKGQRRTRTSPPQPSTSVTGGLVRVSEEDSLHYYKRSVKESHRRGSAHANHDEEEKLAKMWNHLLDKIDLPPQTILTWFSTFDPIYLDNDTLIIATDSEYHLNWCRNHYSRQMSDINVKLILKEIPVEKEST